jgi:two-component sensor histidine kinase
MQQKGNEIILIIHDDGIGINLSPLETPSESLGLKLIKGLSEDIHAVLAIENHLGTKITLVFGVDPLNNGDNSLATTVSPSEYA